MDAGDPNSPLADSKLFYLYLYKKKEHIDKQNNMSSKEQLTCVEPDQRHIIKTDLSVTFIRNSLLFTSKSSEEIISYTQSVHSVNFYIKLFSNSIL